MEITRRESIQGTIETPLHLDPRAQHEDPEFRGGLRRCASTQNHGYVENTIQQLRASEYNQVESTSTCVLYGPRRIWVVVVPGALVRARSTSIIIGRIGVSR